MSKPQSESTIRDQSEDLMGTPLSNGQYLLVKLLPEQIAAQWDTLKEAIAASLPPSSTETAIGMNNILYSLINSFMECWVGGGYKGEEFETYLVATTGIIRDLGGDTKSLLIYSLYGFKGIPQELLNSGIETLRRYARSLGCSKIIAYTNVDRVRQMVTSVGGDVSWTYIQMEV